MSYTYLMGMVGRRVKVNRGGPDSVEGKLLSVQSDYLVVRTRDGIVYINSQHVKSITEGGSGGANSSGGNRRVILAENFYQLLQRLRHEFVQVNRGGPEKIEGFVAEANSNYLLLVVNRELVRIPTFHIKTLSVSMKRSKGNKSSGNKSGGNQSSGNKNQSGGNRSSGANKSQQRSSQGAGRTKGNRAQTRSTAAKRTARSKVR